MDLQRLFQPVPPWLHLLAAETAGAIDRLRALEHGAPGQVAVRVIRGKKSQTASHFFDEAAAALQFPAYFGENWDAFVDSLSDTHAAFAGPVIMVITDADLFLKRAAVEDRTAFGHALEETWHRFHGSAKKPATRFLHVVFQCEPAKAADVQHHWTTAKHKIDEIS